MQTVFGTTGLTCVVLAVALGAERVDAVGLTDAMAGKAERAGAHALASVDEVEMRAYAITVDAYRGQRQRSSREGLTSGS